MMCDDKKIFNNACMMLFIKRKKFRIIRYRDQNHKFE